MIEELRIGIGRADPRDRRREHVDPMPAAEGAGETDDAVALGEAEPGRSVPLLLRIGRRVAVEIGAVGIDQNLPRVDAARRRGPS